LIGVVTILGIGFLISAYRTKINWRPVLCGLILQFLLALFCIRWSVGRMIFECFGEKVKIFLNYGQDGAAFVFGDFLVREKQVFAFTALPIIFFFSLMVSLLYYLGVIQVVLLKLGWILQSILGTTICESVNAAANIFLGMSEGPLIIKPYIKILTHSEIHAIMVSGFATVSGSVLAAYISFGAEASHLITASVMAAPTSLAISKLVWPETEQSKTSSENMQMEKSPDSSALDAASNGASQGIMLILNIIANLVAFVAFIAFIDGMFKWVTYLVGWEDVNIEFVFGKIFIPISWAIGIAWEDCEEIGQVIARKTIINEFVAFQRLGEFIKEGAISVSILNINQNL
jgi:pyrimidine nucleoside transport protein